MNDHLKKHVYNKIIPMYTYVILYYMTLGFDKCVSIIL